MAWKDGRDHHRSNGGYIMGVKSPAWFTDYFGEYDARRFADSGRPCAHCGRGHALEAGCYQGLCADCWTALLLHCMGWAERWLARRAELHACGRDPMELAPLRIRANSERRTLDCLLRVAVDGASPRAEWRKVRARLNARRWRAENPQRSRDGARRWYIEHRERVRATHNRWQRENRDKTRQWNREQYLRRKAGGEDKSTDNRSQE